MDFDQDISSASQWDVTYATFCRLCAAVISDPTPVSLQQMLGGVDLGAMVHHCSKYRVWEKPAALPGWVPIFGWLPAVSVNSINPPVNIRCTQRCSLLMTIAGIERRVGKLVKCDGFETQFESDTGVSVCLAGFNTISLDEAKDAAITAKTWRWTQSTRIIMGSERFGGQGPSQIHAREYTWLGNTLQSMKTLGGMLNLGRIDSGSATRTTKQLQSLGEIVHGCDLGSDYLGLLIECI
jgi:hypothetical protein